MAFRMDKMSSFKVLRDVFCMFFCVMEVVIGVQGETYEKTVHRKITKEKKPLCI